MTKINVLLADDHAVVRRGFRRLLEDDPAITVVGEANDGEEAIALTAQLKPHVVVMDAAMPGTNGLAATKAIAQQWHDVADLLASQGADGLLAKVGVERYVELLERRRELMKKVQAVAGSEYLGFLEQFVELLYEKVRPAD